MNQKYIISLKIKMHVNVNFHNFPVPYYYTGKLNSKKITDNENLFLSIVALLDHISTK